MSTVWKNIKIKSSDGKFYESSKTEVEGWTKVETKEHGTRWHRIFSNLQGKLAKIDLDEEGQFGDRLKVYVETDTDEVSVLEINLFNTNKSINDYVRSLCQRLGNLNIGDEVDIFLNTKYKNNRGYLNKFMVVKVDDNIVEKALAKEDVPKWVEKQDPIKKDKKIWDRTDETAFFYNLLKSWIGENTKSYSSDENDSTEVTTTSTVSATIDDDDDLPF